MDAWLHEENARRVIDAAAGMNMSPAKLLNLIVAVALEELEGADDDIEITVPIRNPKHPKNS